MPNCSSWWHISVFHSRDTEYPWSPACLILDLRGGHQAHGDIRWGYLSLLLSPGLECVCGRWCMHHWIYSIPHCAQGNKDQIFTSVTDKFQCFFYLLACYANNTDLVKKLSFVASDAEGTKHFFVFTNSDLKITFVFKWGKHLFIFDIMSSVDAVAQQSWSRRCDGPAAFFSSALADVSWLSGVPWTACSLQSAHICVGDGLRAWLCSVSIPRAPKGQVWGKGFGQDPVKCYCSWNKCPGMVGVDVPVCNYHSAGFLGVWGISPL